MPIFEYTVVDKSGKKTHGLLNVVSKAQAIKTLEGMGLFPISVKLSAASEAKPIAATRSPQRRKLFYLIGGLVCALAIVTAAIVHVRHTAQVAEEMTAKRKAAAFMAATQYAELEFSKIDIRTGHNGLPDFEKTISTGPVKYVDVFNSCIESAKWLKEAADYGDARAINNLAILRLQGKGLEKDEEEALRLFKKSARLGNPEAWANLKRVYVAREYDDQGYAGFKWHEKRALDGDPEAQTYLGNAYMQNEIPDEPKAKGHGSKLTDVLRIAKALQYYEMAATQGYTEAQYKLGSLLAKAKDAKNRTKAYAWLLLACQRGHQNAVNLISEAGLDSNIVKSDLDNMFNRLSERIPKDVTTDESKLAEVSEWYRRAAEHGDANAPFVLAKIYYYGIGVKKDVVTAKAWCDIIQTPLAGQDSNGPREHNAYFFSVLMSMKNPLNPEEEKAKNLLMRKFLTQIYR